MKRNLKLKADYYAIADDDGSVIVGNGNNVQVVDVESIVKRNYDLNKPIRYLGSGLCPVVGIDGSAMLINEKGKLTQYLFPVGLESLGPTCSSFSSTETFFAVGVGMVALVYNLTKPLEKSLVAVLEGHEANIKYCTFMRYKGYEHLLITCSDDNRFMVWDLNRRCLCYESPFESNSPVMGVCSFETNHLFALAFEDGYARLYDASPILNEKPSVKFVRIVNLTKVELTDFEEEEEECIVISKAKPKKLLPDTDPTAEPSPYIIGIGSAVMADREFMLVATAASVIAFNVNTLEKSVCYSFEEAVSAVAFKQFIVGAWEDFSRQLCIKRIVVGIVPELGAELFPADDPPEDSPLLAEVQAKTKQATPIATLHKNVKSSGYTSKPPGPPNRLKRAGAGIASGVGTKAAKAGAKAAKGKKGAKPEKEEITSFKVPKTVSSVIQVHSNPISTAALSPDGKRLICADGSGAVVYAKVKASTFPAYLGHSQAVCSLGWDSDCHFVTGSLDKTAKIWDINRPDPLLQINTLRVPGKGPTFTDEISGASFLWRDKFVCLASGKSVHLFAYKLPNLQSKNVQDMHQTGTYKGVCSVGVDSGKIVSFAASNLPASPIVAAATSAKSVVAFDFYTCQKAVEFETQHERGLHTVIADFGGQYTPRAPDATGLLLTGAFDETFRLWDLRSARCVRTIVAGSRTVKTGCCFSPDSRFVAVGTERMGVEIWDIGAGACVEKLKDDFRGTTVTWLGWNPSSGRLQCGTEAGAVKIFS